MDTGSDLVWFPCSPFECILCENKYDSNIPTTPFNISSAFHLPCNSPACSAAHSSLPSSDLCAISHCPLETIEVSDCSAFSCPSFYYAYGDGSLIARLYKDQLSLPLASSSLNLPNFTFGCAHTTLGEPIGVAGFGQGLLSLPAQLAKHSPQLGNSFSYCLISHSFDVNRIRKPSPLILGRSSFKHKENKDSKAVANEGSGNNGVVEGEEEFLYTPILHNPKHPYFYCVGLEAITVGKKRIPAMESLKRVNRKGNGGMVVDSGTTFTMLPTKLYEAIVTEFENTIGSVLTRANQVEEQTGLNACYYYDNELVSLTKVPKLVLHFVGNSSVTLPRRNYFFKYMDGSDGKKERHVGCLMLMNGGDEEDDGPVATLGNIQQQGFEVVYDLVKRRVGFARRQCSTLWDSLNQD
ncbi:Aspartyl protease family protein [Thalictrum thalictroides]|uniref:Aspartyl protease family protein n=1 Tax=Thalictrum thalictroides TaxID=46969 RepID=A0A7J6V578_THATH|nr:Aspartyl protease family protein [Thalictrum thalictroides]